MRIKALALALIGSISFACCVSNNEPLPAGGLGCNKAVGEVQSSEQWGRKVDYNSNAEHAG